MTLHKTLFALAILIMPLAATAQSKAPPYDLAFIKQEPEMGMGKASFQPSPKVRGMKGLDETVLLVSADNQSLAAYKKDKLLWKTNLVAACPGLVGSSAIRSVVSESAVAVIFVVVGKHTFLEVNRKSGVVTSIKSD